MASKKGRTWFDQPAYERLHIKDYLHSVDKQPAREKLIQDPKIIRQFIEYISALPEDGEMMISFVPLVPQLDLEFYAGDKKTVVEFYGGKIKTPGTSFFMEKHDEEDHAFQLAQTLLK